MCGVMGVIGGNIDLRKFVSCLDALSTRGQEATGISGFSNGFINEKCQGTASNLGDQLPDLSEILEIGIGSTRYPTIGTLEKESIRKHLAPFTESTKAGLLSLAFNGNIIYPSPENGMNDGALITRLFKEKIEEKKSIYEAVRELLLFLDGAYSVVAMLGDDKIIAFRDPYGIRPLCWGELNNGYVITSETRILEKYGVEKFHFIPPGGLIIFNKDSFEKHRIIFEKLRHCMFEWTYFSQATSVNEGNEVYQVRYNLGRKLGELMELIGIHKADYVIPVPKTAKTAAVGCSDYLGLNYADGLIKSSFGRIFIKPTEEARITAVNDIYEPVRSIIKNNDIIVIDDSIVRGTTLKRVITLLREKGANKIHVGITTPKIKYPCVYGIDMSRSGELLAAKNNENEIIELLKCDSLTYMTLEGLNESIGLRGLCTACLDGNYPTPKGKTLFQNIRKLNGKMRLYEQSDTSR